MKTSKPSPITCWECGEPIESREDLITSWRWLAVRPFHSPCYAKTLKGFRTIFTYNYPINGFSGNFAAVVGVVFGFYFAPYLFTKGIVVGALWLILAFLAPVARVYSWWRYERHLS